jgi:exosortase
LSAGAIVVLLFGIYGQTLTALAADWWSDPASSYGMLVAPLALFTAWHFRSRLFILPGKGESRGLIAVAFACLLFLIARLGGQFFLARLSFVVLLAGITWTFWGLSRAKVLAFPFLLLVVSFPVPNFITSFTLPLQLFSSATATRFVQSLGGTVFRDGNIIQTPNGAFSVAEACSGLNSLMALTIGAILVGYLQCKGALSRTLLVLLTIPLAIAANVFRVAGTVLIANYREELATGFYHLFSGLLVFVCSFGLLILIARLLNRSLERAL